MTKRLITILWLCVQCAAYAQLTPNESKGPDNTNVVDGEALRKLLPQFGRILDQSINLSKTNEVDSELLQMCIDGRYRDLTADLKVGTAESSFVRLLEVIRVVDGMAVRPANWDFYPEKHVRLPEIKKALGKANIVRTDVVVTHDQSELPPGFALAPTTVEVRFVAYGRWDFGVTTNDATVVIRVHFDPSPIKKSAPLGNKP